MIKNTTRIGGDEMTKKEQRTSAKSPIKRLLYVNDDGCSCVIDSLSRVVTTRDMCPSGCRVVKMKEEQ